MMTELVFWLAVALVAYAYVGYPAALMLLSALTNRTVRKGCDTPPVSFIITAHNEEARIAEKIENTLAQDYPGQFEIIVASDCSTDGTDDAVRAYAPRVQLVRAAERHGKEAAQRLAVQSASGELLVFSDVATALAIDGVSTIISNFSDPTVGCVSSIDRFVDADGRISGEGAYVRYEMWLRQLETRVGTLVGLSGSFFAARRHVCRQLRTDQCSDFTTLLNSVESGLRGVLDPASVGYYTSITDHRRELQRKIRTVVRGIGVLSANKRMLNPLRYGFFAWQLASHKLCRWLVPVAMAAAFAANMLLVFDAWLYGAALGLQIGWYAAVAAGWAGSRTMRVPYFFFAANLAILIAWFRYARGERMVTWTPSQRTAALPQVGIR
jgi:cellulose synthase/poly-beta-1,6-N-acetylglucosamine synthase-like glycosyltransferase